ncbi:hypothetical protein BC936DRAFT_147976 [Jimgerdemannia flammicorona]|uniref:SnoaL-like domain-containing protein n=1 Tax=Jimgerdemannia flammicorona TaxID=994334 RepID=A0A433D413_9FUNG|nr:hypothetical protein BC936DRAFT_147976 [Jimgerdemannia flammicorona]
MSVERVWSAYKANRANEALYTEDAHVVYLPTSAGARGVTDIVKFYSQQDFAASVNVVKEVVHKKAITADAVIEEVEWSITFNNGYCCWLLPSLDESHLIDATLVFPAVVSASFIGERISSVRVYWDQAGLLRQLKVIGERQRWPIRGIEQVDALRKPHLIQLNPFGPGTPGARILPGPSGPPPTQVSSPPKKHHMASNIFGDPDPSTQRLSSRVNQPGGTGGKSSIFSDDTPLPGQRRTTGKGILPGFDPDEDPTSARSPPHNALTKPSSILPGFDRAEESEQQGRGNRPGQHNQPGATGGISHIFDDPVETLPRRPQGPATGGISHIFDDPVESLPRKPQGPVTTGISRIFDDPVETLPRRPQSRPSNKDEDATEIPSASGRSNFTGRGNASSFSITDADEGTVADRGGPA